MQFLYNKTALYAKNINEILSLYVIFTFCEHKRANKDKQRNLGSPYGSAGRQ